MLDLFGFNKPPKSLKQPKDGLERKLATAVIQQAVMDACMANVGTIKATVGHDGRGKPVEKWSEAHRRAVEEAATSARDWLLHDNHAFVFYCYSMNMEPWAVREYMKTLEAGGWAVPDGLKWNNP